jgi:hypothetical protein
MRTRIPRKISSDPIIESAVRALLRAGWVFKHGKKHHSITSPSGIRITIAKSPSDSNAAKNFLADLRRVGVEVPK